MSLVQEIDYGTPASKSTQAVTLTIDGNPVTVPAGTSIMRAAMDAGIQVPKLCATDSVDAFGSCRLCLVEIAGRAGTPASCTTPVAAGMVFHCDFRGGIAAAPNAKRGLAADQTRAVDEQIQFVFKFRGFLGTPEIFHRNGSLRTVL